jgi:hypothetical protein
LAEFYVKSSKGKLVPAQFLRDRGAPIPDPNPNATRYVLRDRNGVPLEEQNVGNYYIVPEGYSLDDAREYGDSLRLMGGDQLDLLAVGSMTNSFRPGGPQDWQRKYTYADGTAGIFEDPVPAFRHSTSFILGFVTERSGIPLAAAETGGGWLNRLTRWLFDNKQIDTSGSEGNDPENLRSIRDGSRYSNRDAKSPTYRGGRLYLDEYKNAVRAKFEPAPANDQLGHGDAVSGMRSDGGEVQLASYRFARLGDSTPTSAMRALNAAKADDAFTKRYLRGDRDAVDYMHALHRAAYPEPGSDSPNLGEAGDSVRGAPRRSLSGGSAGAAPQLGAGNGLAPWMSEATAAARKALTELTSDKSFVDRYLDGGRKEFDRFQGLMRTAYPEGSAAGGDGAEAGGARTALEPWSPAVSGDSGAGVAPWLRDAFTREATRAPGVEPDAESTLAPWMDYRKTDWARES